MDPRDIARDSQKLYALRLRSTRVISELGRGYVPVTYRPLGRARRDDPPGCKRVRVRASERALIARAKRAEQHTEHHSSLRCSPRPLPRPAAAGRGEGEGGGRRAATGRGKRLKMS